MNLLYPHGYKQEKDHKIKAPLVVGGINFFQNILERRQNDNFKL